jgi:hypothetical protein
MPLTDAHTKALTELASALGKQKKWQESIECAEQAVQVSASKHGCGHFTAAYALHCASHCCEFVLSQRPT